jgi:hypothetical protein
MTDDQPSLEPPARLPVPMPATAVSKRPSANRLRGWQLSRRAGGAMDRLRQRWAEVARGAVAVAPLVAAGVAAGAAGRLFRRPPTGTVLEPLRGESEQTQGEAVVTQVVRMTWAYAAVQVRTEGRPSGRRSPSL